LWSHRTDTVKTAFSRHESLPSTMASCSGIGQRPLTLMFCDEKMQHIQSRRPLCILGGTTCVCFVVRPQAMCWHDYHQLCALANVIMICMTVKLQKISMLCSCTLFVQDGLGWSTSVACRWDATTQGCALGDACQCGQMRRALDMPDDLPCVNFQQISDGTSALFEAAIAHFQPKLKGRIPDSL
jgi:hypothetical protein